MLLNLYGAKATLTLAQIVETLPNTGGRFCEHGIAMHDTNYNYFHYKLVSINNSHIGFQTKLLVFRIHFG